MHPELKIAAQMVREAFAEAAGYRRQANALPRWRWLKRYNLREKADVAEIGSTMFWNDCKLELAFETFIDQYTRG